MLMLEDFSGETYCKLLQACLLPFPFCNQDLENNNVSSVYTQFWLLDTLTESVLEDEKKAAIKVGSHKKRNVCFIPRLWNRHIMFGLLFVAFPEENSKTEPHVLWITVAPQPSSSAAILKTLHHYFKKPFQLKQIPLDPAVFCESLLLLGASFLEHRQFISLKQNEAVAYGTQITLHLKNALRTTLANKPLCDGTNEPAVSVRLTRWKKYQLLSECQSMRQKHMQSFFYSRGLSLTLWEAEVSIYNLEKKKIYAASLPTAINDILTTLTMTERLRLYLSLHTPLSLEQVVHQAHQQQMAWEKRYLTPPFWFVKERISRWVYRFTWVGFTAEFMQLLAKKLALGPQSQQQSYRLGGLIGLILLLWNQDALKLTLFVYFLCLISIRFLSSVRIDDKTAGVKPPYLQWQDEQWYRLHMSWVSLVDAYWRYDSRGAWSALYAIAGGFGLTTLVKQYSSFFQRLNTEEERAFMLFFITQLGRFLGQKCYEFQTTLATGLDKMNAREGIHEQWPTFSKKVEAALSIRGVYKEFKYSFFESEFWQSPEDEMMLYITDKSHTYVGHCFFVPMPQNKPLVFCDMPERIDVSLLPNNT